MDKLTAIKVFLSVAETGSFTATADRLDMSKPMITRHIALMEEWLNARLFQRTTRQVQLTDAGEQAMIVCQKMLALSIELEQELSAQQGDLRGNIRLSSSGSFGTTHLTKAVNVFLREHPNLNIHLELSDKLLDLVAERIDLAVRITNQPDPNLVARKLADCHSLIVATPEYLARFGTPKHPEDLRHHRYLTHANINRKEWYFYQENQELVLELTSQLTTNETTVLLNSVLSHSGVAMLPKYLLEDYLQTGQLTAVLTDWQLPKFTIYLLYPSRHKLPLAVQRLVDFLMGYFEGRDW